MKSKTFMQVASAIFAIVALLHLARASMAWPAQIAGWQVPLWLSWIALIFAGYLSYSAFKLAQKAK